MPPVELLVLGVEDRDCHPLHEEAEGFQIFNPGSPTERRRSPAHTMGLARVARGRVEFELVALD